MSFRKYTILLVFVLLSISSVAQYSFYKVTRDGVELNSPSRFGMDIGLPINLIGPWSIIPAKGAFSEVGIFISNNGIIYDELDHRYIHRALGLSIPLRAGKIVNDKYYIGAGVNFNFNFHYKQTNFDYGTKDNKSIVIKEFFSDQINVFYPSIELSAGIRLHGIGRFSLRLQTFAGSLLNQAFVDDAGLKPYETLVVPQNFKILLSYNSGL